MKILSVVYPVLPPTSNKIYFRGTRLTTKAREYAETFSHYFARNYLHLVNDLDPSAIYAVHLRFYFNTLINETYNNPAVPKSKRAKTRYKKIDLTNRIKLLEDCVRDAISVDDSQTFVASQEKHMDPGHERVEIYIHEVDPSMFGVPLEVGM